MNTTLFPLETLERIFNYAQLYPGSTLEEAVSEVWVPEIVETPGVKQYYYGDDDALFCFEAAKEEKEAGGSKYATFGDFFGEFRPVIREEQFI
ncbi:hypothetical protein [Dyadobacter bucti]|uniref:hypothetical protein n=1 Tax=Dyadobacter bucti TaxID=2572203 RepID=UPI001108B66C|nr:hypothetical protein [Dyadobacter bucti]